MAERSSEEPRQVALADRQPLAGSVFGDWPVRSPVESPQPLPTPEGWKRFFQLNALELGVTNNAYMEDGYLGDRGQTGAGMAKIQMGDIGCTSVSVGGELSAHTEHDRVKDGVRTRGMHRDDEAKLYVSFGQQGACVQPIVDRFREALPWAHITSVSWEGRVGGAGTGPYGGLPAQDLIHRKLPTGGGTLANGTLADQYGPRLVGVYGYGSGYVGSGAGPLSVGLRVTGEVAPAATSAFTTGIELQLNMGNAYLRLGFAGSVQQSAMSEFDGARKDGPYAAAFGALGYQGDKGGGVEFRVAQNALGTGLGVAALGDEQNLTAAVRLKLTKDGFFDYVEKLRFW